MELNDIVTDFPKPMPEVTATIQPLPFEYDENDSRVMDTIDMVADFCGYEFTEVPPNPDGEDNPNYNPNDPDNPENPPKEGGDIMPLDDDINTGDDEKGDTSDEKDTDKPKPGDDDFVIDPDDPDKEGQIDPDVPGEPYPELTDEMDTLREAYKKAKEENYEERKAYWGRLWQVIRFISSITCWTDGPADTFFVQFRKQVYHAEQECPCKPTCCGCDPDQVIIPLDYTPLYDKGGFIDGWITVMINGEPVKEKIPFKYLEDHYDPSTGKVYINRSDFPDTLLYRGNCCCLCRRKLTITLLYNAGYVELPPALLPLLCPLMAKMNDAQMGMSDCANAMNQVSGYLKMKKVGNIQYQWSDTDNNQAKTLNLMTDLYNLATLDEIMALSRCMLAEMPNEIGDIV